MQMEEQRVTISDIAEELGVSTATVSNVLHGKTGKISEATAQRVMEHLEQRGYIPNMAGILMARNSSKIVGIFLNDHEKYEGHTLDDVFIASSLNFLSKELEKNSRFMMVKTAHDPKEILTFASMWNMEGVVVIGFCKSDYQYLRSHMRIPFVVYDGQCDTPERFVNITIDNFDGGRQVGEHFRRLGHERALCIADNDVGVDRLRFLGFREGFGAGELLTVPMQKLERRRFYRAHLQTLRAVTAIFSVSDHYAVDLMGFLAENGIAVPQTLSIAGFDDIPMCEAVFPTLTTVQQDGALRAKIAVETLQRLSRGEAVETEICLPVTLVERGSTGRRK